MVDSFPQKRHHPPEQTAAGDGLYRRGVKPMTNAAGEGSKDDSPLLHAAIALAPLIRAEREEIERGRRLPPRLAHAMKEAGIFGMTMPLAWGRPDLAPP